MRYVLDTSTIIPLLLDYGEKLIDITTKVNLYVTDLSIYEVGNTLWKLVTVMKAMKLEDAEDIIYVLNGFMRKSLFRVIRFEDMDLQKLLQLAVSEKLTFYDASYIITSETVKATLATEDTELREKAKKYVNVIRYKELAEELFKVL